MSEAYRKKHQSRQSADWLVDADGKPLGLIGPEGKVYQPVIAETGPGGGNRVAAGEKFLFTPRLVEAVPGVDTSAAIQAELEQSAGVCDVVLSGEHTVNWSGISVPSNSVLRFAPGAKLSLTGHNTTTYQILRLHDVENVEIYHPHVDGRKDLNTAVNGEWGMGISIRGGKNIRIYDPVTENCWGDGIYIGSSVGWGTTGGARNCSEDVEIYRHKASGNRRQGMSIVSARRCRVVNPVWENTQGTNPQAGLDIEPNYATEDIQDVSIENPVTYNNAGPGVLIDIRKLTGESDKFVSLSISSHTDNGSLVGMQAQAVATGSGVRGLFEIASPRYYKAKESAVRVRGWSASGPVLRITQPLVLDCNTLAGTNQKYYSSFSLFREPSDTGGYEIGGIQIVNPTIQNVGTVAPSPFYVKDTLVSPLPVKEVRIIDPIKIIGVTTQAAPVSFFGEVSDKYKKWARTITFSTVLSEDSATPTVLHDRTSLSLITLPTGAYGRHAITIENVNTGQLKILPPSGGMFLGKPVNAYYACTGVGHYLRLTPLGSGVWRVDEISGDWTLTAT